MLERASERCRSAIERARRHAIRLKHPRIGTGHMLLALLDEGAGVGASTLRHLGVDVTAVRAEIERRLVPGADAIAPTAMSFDEDGRSTLAAADAAAKQRRSAYVGTEHLLLGLLADSTFLSARVLLRYGVTEHDAAAASAELKTDPSRPKSEAPRANRTPRGRHAFASVLDAVGVDLGHRTLRRALRPVCGRFSELERLKAVLAEEGRPSALLLGSSGAGKTSAIFALARDILIGNVPTPLLCKRLIAIDQVRLVAGCRHKDQLEERVDDLLREAARSRDVILVFDDVEWLIHDEREREGRAAERQTDLLDVFSRIGPALESRAVQALATATFANDRREAARSRYGRWFNCIDLEPADAARALLTLVELREQFEAHHRVTITEDALKMAVQIALGAGDAQHVLPRAIRLLDETGARLAAEAFTPPVRMTRLGREIERLEYERAAAFERKDHTAAAQNFEEARVNRELRDQIFRRWKTELREHLRVIDETAIGRTYALAGGWHGLAGAEARASNVDDDLTLGEPRIPRTRDGTQGLTNGDD